MAVTPNPLMKYWTNTLEREITTPCNPAGRPMRTISFVNGPSTVSFLTLMTPLFSRYCTAITAESTCDSTDDQATARTPLSIYRMNR